jgi:hypothetical protein
VPVGVAYAASVYALSYAVDAVFHEDVGSALRTVAPLLFVFPSSGSCLQLSQASTGSHRRRSRASSARPAFVASRPRSAPAPSCPWRRARAARRGLHRRQLASSSLDPAARPRALQYVRPLLPRGARVRLLGLHRSRAQRRHLQHGHDDGRRVRGCAQRRLLRARGVDRPTRAGCR